jgi:hypothetical protein
MLIDAGRAAEADTFFDAALRRNPKRSRSLAGRGRAAVATGAHDRAREYYTALLANFEHADADVALVTEARAALAHPAAAARAEPWWLGLFASTGGLMIVGLAVTMLAVGLVVMRRAVRAEAARTKKSGAPKRARRQ